MRIGPENWHWLTIDTAGVPSGGKYGDVRQFAELIAAEGWKLAWNQLWKHFVMYEELPDGSLVPHMHFVNWATGAVIPVREAHVGVFRHMREKHADKATVEMAIKAELDGPARRAREMAEAERAEREARRPEIIRATDLSLGLSTPRMQIIVPGGR